MNQKTFAELIKPQQSTKKTTKTAVKTSDKTPAKKTASNPGSQKKSHSKPASNQAGKNSTSKPQTKKELEKLRSDIARDKEKLREMKKKEHQVSSKLSQYKQKSAQVASNLQKISTSLSRVSDSLKFTTGRMNTVAANAAILRREYADLVYAASRTEAPTTDEMLLGVESMKEASLIEGTMRHLNLLATGKISDSEKKRDSLRLLKEKYAAKRTEAESLKQKQEQEKNKIQSAISSKAQELQSVQASREALLRRLEERNASAKKLEAMIGSLVGKSESSKNTHSQMMKNANKGDDNSAEQAAIEARAASLRGGFRRHSLPWPTENHTIIHKFGRYTNPGTGTVIENLGVGIAAKSGTSIRAVAKGVVSLVNWLPGYGSLVIIDHGNTFRTVYANLASVSIHQGQSVKAGAIIGRSGRSVDGEYLHFELWHDRSKLNPAHWLE